MGKGSKERWMPVGTATVEAAWEYLQARNALGIPHHDYLWASRYGNPLTPDEFSKVVKRLGRKVGVDLFAHMFRHAWTINQLADGMPEILVKHNGGGWARHIPQNYLRTLSDGHVAEYLRNKSPGDRLAQGQEFAGRPKMARKAKRRL